MQQREFARNVDALDEIVAFTADAAREASLGREALEALHFVIEELVTNMIKYAPVGAPRISIGIDCDAQGSSSGVEVTLIDSDVDRFDPTLTADARVDAPVAERTPGGLGLHLSRRLAGALSYDYDPTLRRGRTRFSIGGPAC